MALSDKILGSSAVNQRSNHDQMHCTGIKLVLITIHSLAIFRFLKSESLGSLCKLYGMSLSSVSPQKTLNFSANWTTCYEHDHPTTHSLIYVTRPPIPSKETERVIYADQIVTAVNPGTNVVFESHKIRWGPKSKTEKHAITVRTTWGVFK